MHRFRRYILEFNRKHRRRFPWRESTDPFEILIGEILLQRTRAENTTEVFLNFISRWPHADALASANLADIEWEIRSLGLNKRAKYLHRIGRILSNSANFPMDPRQLIKLPGIGPYVAHAIPIFARNQNLPLVDWVISRVLRRYFEIDSVRRPTSDRGLWRLSAKIAEPGNAREIWIGTLDLAARYCKRKPLCRDCPLKLGCGFALSGKDAN